MAVENKDLLIPSKRRVLVHFFQLLMKQQMEKKKKKNEDGVGFSMQFHVMTYNDRMIS